MPRLDGGRGPKFRDSNYRGHRRDTQVTTGARVIKAGPPATDYTKKYEKGQGCPLTAYIQEYYKDNQQTTEDYKEKDKIRNWIEECFEKCGLDFTCYIVGSTSNGFGTKHSDVDICVVVDHDKVFKSN